MNDVSVSKFLAKVLRHRPELIGIVLDEHGWADTKELIAGTAEHFPGFTEADLDRIVETNNKHRYAYNEDHTKIRASQGHTIPVDIEMEVKQPPEVLWHGTGESSADAIAREGLKPMKRLYVHLSADPATAYQVGRRHGKPVIFLVESGRMYRDGYAFRISANGVWQTDAVPPEYLERQR